MATPKRDLGSNNYKKFLEVCKEEFTGPELFKKWVNLLWDDRKTFEWIMPDNFRVSIPCFVHKEEEIECLKSKGLHISFGEYHHESNGNYRHLLANMTHAVDAYICREVIRAFDEDLLTIHDAYLVHPNHADTLRKVYRQVLVKVYVENPIKSIIKALFGHSEEYTEERENKVFPIKDLQNSITKGIYAIC